MKYTCLVYLFLSLLVVSCNNEENDPDSIIGEWELVEIYNPWTGESSTEHVAENFQTYQFFSNGTFIKTRVQEEGDLKTAKGSFTTEDVPPYSSSDAKMYVNLVFNEGAKITNNCGQPNEEQLVLRFNNQLNNFSATPCDGPGYTFEKD